MNANQSYRSRNPFFNLTDECNIFDDYAARVLVRGERLACAAHQPAFHQLAIGAAKDPRVKEIARAFLRIREGQLASGFLIRAYQGKLKLPA